MATGRAARALRLVLAISAVFNLVGAVILFAAPQRMIGLFGLTLDDTSVFLCSLLGACSLGFAALSAVAALRPYPAALAAAVSPNVVFNAATVVVGIVVFTRGFSPLVWANIGIHLILALAIAAAGLAFRRAVRATQGGSATRSAGPV